MRGAPSRFLPLPPRSSTRPSSAATAASPVSASAACAAISSSSSHSRNHISRARRIRRAGPRNAGLRTTCSSSRTTSTGASAPAVAAHSQSITQPSGSPAASNCPATRCAGQPAWSRSWAAWRCRLARTAEGTLRCSAAKVWSCRKATRSPLTRIRPASPASASAGRRVAPAVRSSTASSPRPNSRPSRVALVSTWRVRSSSRASLRAMISCRTSASRAGACSASSAMPSSGRTSSCRVSNSANSCSSNGFPPVYALSSHSDSPGSAPSTPASNSADSAEVSAFTGITSSAP
ncbi:hypothetical protein [Crossiella cryophila]|uniref:Uncharacterized protein n=1 Tax=Crossiella cryophila TaxID=43355 RepID=A0A7W7CH41_9PSEU|nr:hypothetical protein [Crossiella cryophila]MBB4679681.1 hypothetical protein [Crossiella cryophila]